MRFFITKNKAWGIQNYADLDEYSFDWWILYNFLVVSINITSTTSPKTIRFFYCSIQFFFFPITLFLSSSKALLSCCEKGLQCLCEISIALTEPKIPACNLWIKHVSLWNFKSDSASPFPVIALQSHKIMPTTCLWQFCNHSNLPQTQYSHNKSSSIITIDPNHVSQTC